jgi:hypothetical protein
VIFDKVIFDNVIFDDTINPQTTSIKFKVLKPKKKGFLEYLGMMRDAGR